MIKQTVVKTTLWLAGLSFLIVSGLFVANTQSSGGLYSSSNATAPKSTAQGRSRLTLGGNTVKPRLDLPNSRLSDFHAGQALAKQPWIKAPTATNARDGLGPLFNARSCLACHPKGGRGKVPENGKALAAGAVVKFASIDGEADPIYGEQFQHRSVELLDELAARQGKSAAQRDSGLRAEGQIKLQWHELEHVYPDGETLFLRRPEIVLAQLNYGALNAASHAMLRLAPPMYGLGWLEQIPEKTLLAAADPNDDNYDGIRGQAAINKSDHAMGRFGWKANHVSVLSQTASAFSQDMGITSPLFPLQACSSAQVACAKTRDGAEKQPVGPAVEISGSLLGLTRFFAANIQVPRGASEHRKGRVLFTESGCQQCHTQSYDIVSGKKEITIYPYTNLLLHDLGEGLSESVDLQQGKNALWRTAPLWGLSANNWEKPVALLHDGRARTVAEAILWHGGEAQESVEYFRHLSQGERQTLIDFVENL